MALRVAAHSFALGAAALFAVFDRASHFVFGFAALGTAELLHNEEKCQLWITNKAKQKQINQTKPK